MGADRTLTCCLTFDFDGLAAYSRGTRDRTRASQGEFAGAVGLPRVLDVLRAYDVPATFFCTGDGVLSYPGLIERARADGHEIAHHGWTHETPAELDRDTELRYVERGIEAIERITGTRPRGYRAPSWAASDHTVEILREQGFAYDSSFMAGDFHPYYLRSGDTWFDDEPPVFGEPCDLVEIPVYWGLDDGPVFEYLPGVSHGLRSPAEIEESWRGDFDYAHAHCPGGVYTLTLHPVVIGRGQRILVLQRLIEHFRNAGGVAFRTVAGFAEEWSGANPLAAWAKENPLYVNPQRHEEDRDG